MQTYEETMAFGRAQYADVLDRLNAVGLPAVFTQTGGMCAAIEVQLETGRTLLITDADDSLSWYRNEHRGWGVGLYPPGDHHDGAIAFTETDDGTTEALLATISTVLFHHR
jgi:hypothetical protein